MSIFRLMIYLINFINVTGSWRVRPINFTIAKSMLSVEGTELLHKKNTWGVLLSRDNASHNRNEYWVTPEEIGGKDTTANFFF